MWTDTPEGRLLIQDLSKNVVADLAPEELGLFDEMIQDYFRSPAPGGPSGKEEPLAFGLAEGVAAITPAAAAMVTAVVSFLFTETLKAAQDETAAALKRKIKALFNPEKPEKKEEPKVEKLEEKKEEKKEKETPPPLTLAQLQQVMKLARKQALQFGIQPDLAENMATSLIGSLALVT